MSEIQVLEAGEICQAFISSSCHPKAIIPFGTEYTSSAPTHEELHTDDNYWCKSDCSSGAYYAFIAQLLLSGQRAMSPCPNMSCRCCRRPYPRSIRGDQHRIPLRKYALHTSVVVGYRKGSNRPHPLQANPPCMVHRTFRNRKWKRMGELSVGRVGSS